MTTDNDLGDAFAAYAEESLAIAQETFAAAAEAWGDADAQHLAYVVAVLGVFADADFHDGGLYWHVKDGRVHFAAMCSDTFHWASADAEEIRPDDVPLLRSCLTDLQRLDGIAPAYLPELYAARRRGMRPMRLYLWPKRQAPALAEGWAAVRDLFLACGPERDPATEG